MKTKIKLSVLCFMPCLLQPANGYTPGFTDGGSCTETTFWRVDALDTGGLKLTVYGTGATHNAHHGGLPRTYWNPYIDYIKDIVEIDVKEGITSIGSGNFGAMFRVRKISLPYTLTYIGFSAFNSALTHDCITVIPSSVTSIGAAVFTWSFRDISGLDIPERELTDEEYVYLSDSLDWVWPDTVPLYFESMPVHAGAQRGGAINVNSIFWKADTVPLTFYIKEDFLSQAQASDIFLSRNNEFTVAPVAYKYPSGKYNATISWEYDYGTKTLFINGYGKIGDERILISPEIPGDTMPVFYPDQPWWIPEVRDSCERLIVGEGITRLGVATFCEFAGLKDVYFPQSLLYMYSYTFNGCTSLKTLVLPSNLQVAGYKCFTRCNKLQSVYIENVNPPGVPSGFGLGGLDFPWNNPGFTIYVPPHAIQNYWTAEYYSDHASQIKPYESIIYTGDIITTDTTRIPVTVNDTAYISVTVNDTTRVEHIITTDTTRIPVTVNDTTRVEHIITDTTYNHIKINLTDTVWTTQYKTEYEIYFVPVEIETDIYPFPEETKTPFLQRLTPTTFQSSSPYNKETLYFYNISGELADKITYYGGETVQTSRPFYHTVIIVSDRGWYQVIY